MPKYRIRGALGGGFGGCENQEWETIELPDDSAAEDAAHELACEEYERYLDCYGLRSVSTIMEEDEIDDEEEALEVFYDERASWLDHEWQKVDA